MIYFFDNIMFILLLRKGKRVYPYQLWMVEKNSIYIITWKKRFLQSLMQRRYYWQKLHSSEKNLQRFLNIKFRRISWFTCLKPYIKVIRWIWEISKYVSLNNWAWSCKIHFSSLISMGSSYIKDWSKTRITKQYWYAINGSKRH